MYSCHSYTMRGSKLYAFSKNTFLRDKFLDVSTPLSRIRVPVAISPSNSGIKTCRLAEKALPLQCQNENQ